MPAFIAKRKTRIYSRRRSAQAMKHSDPLVDAWQRTLRRLKDAPAIFDARGPVLRSFSAIEERAGQWESRLEGLDPGGVIAVQIGNHQDWPAILIACLRRKLVVLPLRSEEHTS